MYNCIKYVRCSHASMPGLMLQSAGPTYRYTEYAAYTIIIIIILYFCSVFKVPLKIIFSYDVLRRSIGWYIIYTIHIYYVYVYKYRGESNLSSFIFFKRIGHMPFIEQSERRVRRDSTHTHTHTSSSRPLYIIYIHTIYT